MNQQLPPMDGASPPCEGPAAGDPIEPSWAGQDPWREDARVSLMCLQMENPDMGPDDIAALLGLSGSRLTFGARALLRMWQMKYRRFLVAENRWGYLRALSPLWLLQKLFEGGGFLAARFREYRALRAELRALEEDDA